MALTTFQRSVCRLLADHRIASGESYVAGASVLNELIASSLVSMDIDLFHDTDEALEASWDADRHLVGRLEVRDWVDLIHACEHLQPLGYLAWAACGKDPGFSPAGILEQAARSSYSAAEVLTLAFATEPPDAGDLSRRWRAMLATGREIVEGLPHMEVGRCVLGREGTLFAGDARGLRLALDRGDLRFHAGRIRGAMPEIKGS